MKIIEEYEGAEFGKAHPELGRPIPHDCRSRGWGLLLGGPRGETAPLAVECKQP